MSVTAEYLRELLHYDPSTGTFTWIAKRRGISVGDVAGRINGDGYRQIQIDGKRYQAHRLAWLYVHGRWPKEVLDHANGDKACNRIANLRECTLSENQQNTTSKNGTRGTSWNKQANKWQASIKKPGDKYVYLGLFETRELAHQAYLSAKSRLHDFQPIPRGT